MTSQNEEVGARVRAPTSFGSYPASVSDPTTEVAALERELEAVDHALSRLRDGSYRACELCGAPIGDELLVADPVRTTCAAHPTLGEGPTSS